MKTKPSESRHSRSHKQKPTTKKGKKAKVKKVMHEWKEGELKTNAGKVVEDQEQAIAIALSESGQSYRDKKKEKKRKG
jgi:hypothetical protein